MQYKSGCSLNVQDQKKNLKDTLMSNLTPANNLVFTDHQRFNFPPCWRDIEVHSRVCRYTVTSLLGVVNGATESIYQEILLI